VLEGADGETELNALYRSVIEQVEFADVILVSRWILISADAARGVIAILRRAQTRRQKV